MSSIQIAALTLIAVLLAGYPTFLVAVAWWTNQPDRAVRKRASGPIPAEPGEAVSGDYSKAA